eukprot:COSAG03_NODE_11584_length_585_cov_1.061728_1_plen_70_part_01
MADAPAPESKPGDAPSDPNTEGQKAEAIPEAVPPVQRVPLAGSPHRRLEQQQQQQQQQQLDPEELYSGFE